MRRWRCRFRLVVDPLGKAAPEGLSTFDRGVGVQVERVGPDGCAGCCGSGRPPGPRQGSSGWSCGRGRPRRGRRGGRRLRRARDRRRGRCRCGSCTVADRRRWWARISALRGLGGFAACASPVADQVAGRDRFAGPGVALAAVVGAHGFAGDTARNVVEQSGPQVEQSSSGESTFGSRAEITPRPRCGSRVAPLPDREVPSGAVSASAIQPRTVSPRALLPDDVLDRPLVVAPSRAFRRRGAAAARATQRCVRARGPYLGPRPDHQPGHRRRRHDRAGQPYPVSPSLRLRTFNSGTLREYLDRAVERSGIGTQHTMLLSSA